VITDPAGEIELLLMLARERLVDAMEAEGQRAEEGWGVGQQVLHRAGRFLPVVFATPPDRFG